MISLRKWLLKLAIYKEKAKNVKKKVVKNDYMSTNNGVKNTFV